MDTADWYAPGEEVPHLAAIAEAVWTRRRISVTYRRWAVPREVERVLEPYGLVLKGGHWYVVAGDQGEPRTYRVARVLSLSTSDEVFERPRGFDLAAHWRSFLDGFDERRTMGEAVVRLSPHGMVKLSDLADGATAAAVRETAVVGADGWTTARIPCESIEHTTSMVLRFAQDAELVSPQWMREQIAATARELTDRYARPVPSASVAVSTDLPGPADRPPEVSAPCR